MTTHSTPLGSRRGSRSGDERRPPTSEHGKTEVDRFLEENGTLSDSEDDAQTLYVEGFEYGKTASPPAGSTSALGSSEEPSSYRRKLRVGVFYVVASSMYQLLVLRMSAKTAWTAPLSLLPVEGIVGSAVGTACVLLARRRRSQVWQSALGTDVPIKPSPTWRELLPLSAMLLLANIAYMLQASSIEAAIGSAISTYAAPALVLLLPLLHLPMQIPSNGFGLLCAISVPFVYGLALTDLRLDTLGMASALAFVGMEASKLALAKKWFMTSHKSPLETIIRYLPVMALLSSLLIMPTLALNKSTIRYPRHWHWYLLSYLGTAAGNHLATMMAALSFDSPVSVALLCIPRGMLVAILHGGLAYGHPGATHEIFIISTLAILALVASLHRSQKPALSRKASFSDVQDAASTESAIHLSPRAAKYLSLASFLPLFYWVISQNVQAPFDINARFNTLRSYTAARAETVDVVIATYNEPAENVKRHIDGMKYYWWIRDRDPRFILYMKGNISDAEAYRKEVGADVAIRLENKGREAGTFLQHILRNYNASVDPLQAPRYRAGLADHTLFMQHHLAWDWIARERMWLWRENTGYLHFAPYLKLDCGLDMNGNGNFPKIAQIYSIFREEFCPPTLQLGAYAAQFVVSKKRILANSYQKYKTLDDILEADKGHWIHEEGTWWHYHGDPGPTNPYLGHAMERSWPIIFGCTDPNISDKCAGENYDVEGCQCFD